MGHRAPGPPWRPGPAGGHEVITVFFRYVFGIPPLILVLVPVSSSPDCERKTLNRENEEYVNVLLPGINRLKNLSHAEVTAHVSNSCRGREPNWLKKLSCSDSKEGMYLYLCQAACKMLQIAKANIGEALNRQLSFVSRDTIDILCCNCHQVREKLRRAEREKETEDPSLTEPYPTRSVVSLPSPLPPMVWSSLASPARGRMAMGGGGAARVWFFLLLLCAGHCTKRLDWLDTVPVPYGTHPFYRRGVRYRELK
uniref:Interleukin-7 n=1 Tax=Ornithorhynchus anatinus TaxID=9258 RepID=A0A6I8PA48_ORNAN